MRDIQPLIEKIKQTVDSHNLGNPGEYTRYTFNFPKGESRRINEYGVADAANILYQIGAFQKDQAFRDGFAKTLKSLQHEDTGLYQEPTHFPIHTTAHCTAAMELFDEKPDLPAKTLMELLDIPKLYEFLDQLDWLKNPWRYSHNGAGIYVIMKLMGLCNREWEDAYFKWFWDETDPKSGMWRKGFVGAPGAAEDYHFMGGSFHYLFNHEYACKPLRYPDKMIDFNLDLFRNKALPEGFGERCGFIEVDWIYCLTRASRQTPHRFYEVKDALRAFAKDYFDYLDQIDPTKDAGFDDLHCLFGVTCAMAELYRALPGEFSAEKPLKLVLDRRPFI